MKKFGISLFCLSLFLVLASCSTGPAQMSGGADAVVANIEDGAIDVDVDKVLAMGFKFNIKISSVNSKSLFVAPIVASPSIFIPTKDMAGEFWPELSDSDGQCDSANSVDRDISCSDNKNCSSGSAGALEYGTKYCFCATNKIESANPAKDGVFEGACITLTTKTMTPLNIPKVDVTTPLPDATNVAVDIVAKAIFSTEMDPKTITTDTFTLSSAGESVVGEVTYDAAAKTATFTPEEGLTGNTIYTATIQSSVKDLAGTSMESDHSWRFTTEDLPVPTVTSTDPSDGQTGIAVNKAVEVIFSIAMDSESINADTFILTGTGSITGTISYDAATKTATFKPHVDLDWSTEHTATVKGIVRSSANVEMGHDYSFSFTTANAPPAPSVTSTVPINTSTGVLVDAEVKAFFSVSMDGTTINDTTFTLYVDEVAVEGTVEYLDEYLTAVFTPSASLAQNTVYRATVKGEVKSAEGIAMGDNYWWTFTTEAEAPTVILTSPYDGESDVSPDALIEATFSEDMDAATVTTDTFTLKVGTTNVTGSVSLSLDPATIATFTPSSPLALLAELTATITNEAKSKLEIPLDQDYVWSFTTSDGVWGTDDVLAGDPASDPALAMSANGDAFALWVRYYLDVETWFYDINASRFDSSSGEWQEPVTLVTSANEIDLTESSIAMNETGLAIATWGVNEGDGNEVYARLWDGESWGDVATISTDTSENSTLPVAGISAGGEAIVVWMRVHTTPELDRFYDIYSSRFSDSAWTENVILSDNTAARREREKQNHKIVVNADGDAIVTWISLDSELGSGIESKRYDAQTYTWETDPQWICEIGCDPTPSDCNTAIDPNGNAMVVWGEKPPEEGFVKARRYISSTWEETITIRTSPTRIVTSKVASDINGNMIAVWIEDTDYDLLPKKIYAKRYSVIDGWDDSETLIYTCGLMHQSCGNSQIAVDENGNGMATWSSGPYFEVLPYASRYNSIANDWETAQAIGSNPVDNHGGGGPYIATDSFGRMIAIWYRPYDYDQYKEIRWNRFEYVPTPE